MDNLFTPKEIVVYVMSLVVIVLSFIVRKVDLKLHHHADHLEKLDKGLYALELDVAKNRPDNSDFEKVEARLITVERIVNRIDARLSGSYRSDRDD